MPEILILLLTPIASPFASWVLGMLGVFVIVLCVYVAIQMHRGDRFCRLFKYGNTLLCGVLAIAFAHQHIVMPVMLVFILSPASFLWPTVLYFFRGDHRNRVGDK